MFFVERVELFIWKPGVILPCMKTESCSPFEVGLLVASDMTSVLLAALQLRGPLNMHNYSG